MPYLPRPDKPSVVLKNRAEAKREIEDKALDKAHQYAKRKILNLNREMYADLFEAYLEGRQDTIIEFHKAANQKE